MSNLAKLYESPLGVARQFALVITGTAEVREKASANAHDLKFMQVRAGTAAYAKCRPEASRLHIEATADAGSNTRIYFLPWSRGSIYRIRPKVGNTVGPDENLFFTPNLDGCLVTVEGSPEAPTIYHSNSAGIQFTQEEEQALGRGPEIRDVMENRLKIFKMASNVGVFSQIPPKTPPVVNTPPKRKKDFDIFEYDRGSNQQMVLNRFDGIDIDQEVYYGAVFGVRKDGNWTFYKQSFRIVRQERDVEDRGFFGLSKPQIVRRKQLEYTVADAKKFWP